MYKGKRIIYNKSSNDFNNEPEYKLQKVRIYGTTFDNKSYIIDSYGNRMFMCDKSQVFLSKADFNSKKDYIKDFKLTDKEKECLENQF